MTERELERRAQRRLAVLRHVEEVSGNVAATCRYYGISRQCYLRLVAPLRSRRTRRVEGPLEPATPLAADDPGGGGLSCATDFAARRNNMAARRSRNMEDDREQRQQQNEHLHRPRSRAPQTAAAPGESELPHLALAEFRTGAHRGLSSDLQTSAPAGITHEVMS